jgi:hypothetical protein
MPLSFRQAGSTFIAGPNIGIYPSGNSFAISGSASGSTVGIESISTIGSGQFSIASSVTNNRLLYRSLSGGSNFSIIEAANGTLTFTATSPTTIISGRNASTGVNVFCGTTTINNTNDALAFFTLSASGDTSISVNSNNEIVVDRGVNIINTLTNLGGGARIFSAIARNSLVQMTIISAATNSGFTASLSSPLKPDAGADSDATSFITAASITDSTQITAIQNLVFDLKENNIWNKMQAIYPIVGGTENSHKYNLRDPRDADAAFRLSFTTGWTHSASGATPNGTSAYADTFYIPSTSATRNSHHLSYYSRTNVAELKVEMGSAQLFNARSFIQISYSNVTYMQCNGPSNTFINFNETNSQGFYVVNRTAASLMNGWKNGVKSATTTEASQPPNDRKYFLGAYNNNNTPSDFSTKQCAFASIGSGLTDSEVATYYTIVEAYQTTLGRQIVASTLRSLGTNTRLNISPSNTTADRFYITTTGPVLNINANYTTLAASSTMSIGGTAVATTRLLLAAGTGVISQIRLTPFATEPTNPLDGSIWYSTSGNTLKLERGTNPTDFIFKDNNLAFSGASNILMVDTGGTISPFYINPFGLFASLSSLTLTDTTSETSIISSILTGSTTLFASTNQYTPELIAGRKFRFNAKGTLITNDFVGLTLRLKLGNTVIGLVNNIGLSDTINGYFEIDYTFTIRSTGATGSVFGSGKILSDNPLKAFDSNSYLVGIYTNTTTLNTTSNQTFDCTVEFDIAPTILTISESSLEFLT